MDHALEDSASGATAAFLFDTPTITGGAKAVGRRGHDGKQQKAKLEDSCTRAEKGYIIGNPCRR
ncbi:uncharacterized protein ARMOST_18774 [Armillaria ostoyae]|uniref:Uncharacterized protein n=1 Tax=Armillaria ostoyae TaxID=47428 RepID=A0A284S2N5_ARMOS|nr:uncharacterized protein ARMOST_18774 [Armillaria ostoyae]